MRFARGETRTGRSKGNIEGASRARRAASPLYGQIKAFIAVVLKSLKKGHGRPRPGASPIIGILINRAQSAEHDTRRSRSRCDSSAAHTSLRLCLHLKRTKNYRLPFCPGGVSGGRSRCVLLYPRARRTSIPNVSPLSSALCVPAPPRARFLFIVILCLAGRRWHDGERSACSFRGAESDNGSPMRDMTFAAANSPPGDDNVPSRVANRYAAILLRPRRNALKPRSTRIIRDDYRRRHEICSSILFLDNVAGDFHRAISGHLDSRHEQQRQARHFPPGWLPTAFRAFRGCSGMDTSSRVMSLSLSRLTTSATAPSLNGFVKLAFASTRVRYPQ